MLRPTDLILVCLLPTPSDLEIARTLGWYPIPLRTAPKVVAVDDLAFFQPSAFGDRGRQIDFVSQVKEHPLTPCGEPLKDHSNTSRAKEKYCKLQMGGLEKLKEPVKSAKWKWLTFLYTTGDYWSKATPLNDLVVKGDKPQFLWRSQREHAEKELLYKTNLTKADIPPEVLIALLKLKEIQEPYDP
jgi:hypothetical protein